MMENMKTILKNFAFTALLFIVVATSLSSCGHAYEIEGRRTVMFIGCAYNSETSEDGLVFWNRSSDIYLLKNGNHVTEIDYNDSEFDREWRNVNRKLTKISIPERIKYEGNMYYVTQIAGDAFRVEEGRSTPPRLERIELPQTIQDIGPCAFMGLRLLKDIKIPDKVTHIWENAFENCQALEILKIPESVVYLSFEIIDGCDNLKKVMISHKTEMHNNTFRKSQEELIEYY